MSERSKSTSGRSGRAASRRTVGGVDVLLDIPAEAFDHLADRLEAGWAFRRRR
ncbi:hypothetical protein [Nonomuraea africana]|uniref:DUF397 domain-containing protein n=1 Tax=Nonomuraea africana TaxID=46171 RepID=A0ABR9KBL8_9ACTN|nr:hypothetical protein [Nonomuraea africana]MBE1559389.1 hypothetical protein [Nonomuraea africana]